MNVTGVQTCALPISVSLAEGVVRTNVVATLGKRSALLHVCLRGIETGAAKVELIIDVRRVGSDGKRVLLRGFVPLLRLLVIHAPPEVLVAFLGEGRQGHRLREGATVGQSRA